MVGGSNPSGRANPPRDYFVATLVTALLGVRLSSSKGFEACQCKVRLKMLDVVAALARLARCVHRHILIGAPIERGVVANQSDPETALVCFRTVVS